MTSLLDPPQTRRTRGAPGVGETRRPLAVGAGLAAVASAAVVLLGCMAVGLVGWFASDSGSHGTTRDALRVGTDAWLLAHGADLHLSSAAGPVTVTAMPLGLTLLCAWVAHRSGRWAAASSAVPDARTLLMGVVVLSGVYGLVGLVAALLVSTGSSQVGPLGALLGCCLLALAGGGSGLLRGGEAVLDLRTRVPDWLRAVGRGALASTLLLFAAGALLLAVALVTDLGAGANVLSRLHAGISGGLLYTVLVAAVAPNAALLSSSYLLGPGFAVGAGTMVSPAVVALGPVPAFPLLAALPPEGTPPAWTSALVATPVVAAVGGVVLMLRRRPAFTYESGAARGLGAGAGGGLLVTVLVVLAGGSVGPGRMAQVGAAPLDTLIAATVPMAVAGLVTGVAVTWWSRRH